ncbi:MAG TPA: TonB-dependent receptor [Stellaceae bacterium]|nr:TonB-dependent receptor [Stellaceae bacterium]
MGQSRRKFGDLRGFLAVVVAVLLIAADAPPGWADPVAVRGSVADLGGQPLAGVALELRNPDGAAVAHGVSDARGGFSLGSVEAGRYVLVARKTGFSPASEPVTLPVPPENRLALALAPAALETITVQARRIAGPGVSPAGASQYSMTSEDIDNLPAGANSALSDVLTQMPGVALDQNQQIHIRNTEGPQFQYQINGILVPLDINTNPPFLSMINPMFVKQVDLQTGIVPSRYSYATGGVLDITTKDGCEQPGGSTTIFGGQRGTLQPSVQYGGCSPSGKFSYYGNLLYSQSNTAFSSATPGPDAIHDYTNQGQGFGFFTYALDQDTKLSVIASAAASNNQLPNVPNLTPQFTLAGTAPFNSADINSYLNFRDYLSIFAINGQPYQDLSYQLAYSVHSVSEKFKPDNAGELIFQGVASTASHNDLDNTLEGDVTWKRGAHTLSSGFYLGVYRVIADDSSLVFTTNPDGSQASTTPISVVNNAHATNVLSGIYVNDLWRIDDQWRLNLGLRWDRLTGFTEHGQVDPTINLSYLPTADTTIHGGFARYMQVPSFQGISPTAQAAFVNTTAAGPAGVATPLTEDDYEWDVGIVHHLTPSLIVSEDNYYEITHDYLDTGQFGEVPIFAPFNYTHGYIWGSELALNYKEGPLSGYLNLTTGRNWQRGIATGQFNFPADELAFINSQYILLDHQPLYGASAGVTYDWKPYSFSLDGIYSSGLRSGFANENHLPPVLQFNASVERSFDIPGVGRVVDRLVLLNLLDRVNLIRPAQGIGIFQSAFGPRFTIFDSITIPF